MPTSDGLIVGRDFCTGAVEERVISDGAVTEDKLAAGAVSITKLASGLTVPQIVGSLPGTANEGELAYLTTDNKLYRYDGAAWILAVDGADITAGTISAGAMVANTLTAGTIAAGAIGTDELAANAVTAGKIAADEITVRHLKVGSYDNLIVDPGLESGEAIADSVHSFTENGAEFLVTALGARSGGYGIRYNPSGATGAGRVLFNGGVAQANHVQCAEGDQFYLSGYTKYGAGTTTNSCTLLMNWYDETDSLLSSSSAGHTPGAAFALEELQGTAPAGVAYVIFEFRVNNDGNDRIIVADDFYARRMTGTLVIEDQAVDIERMLDPVWAFTDHDVSGLATITTTSQDDMSVTLTVPSWVGELHITETYNENIYFTVAQSYRVDLYIGGAAQGSITIAIPATTAMNDHWDASREITSPGASVVCKNQVKVLTSSETWGSGRLTITALGLR